jgi:hypothetical protein
MALGSCFLEQLQRSGGGRWAAAAIEHHFGERDLSIRHAGISCPGEPRAGCLEVALAALDQLRPYMYCASGNPAPPKSAIPAAIFGIGEFTISLKTLHGLRTIVYK